MKKSIFCRVVSMALALCMLFGCVPAGAAESSVYEKVADPSTMNTYSRYFNANNTEYAGLVWTDKSVFTEVKGGDTSFAAANGSTLPTVQCSVNGHTHSESEMALLEDENFLVALSTSASNKSIMGYDKRPTDTIFVIDITGSMSSGKDPKIEKLIPAVNIAIETLMINNKNNRIGVVLYAQNQDRVIPLLELGRYTAQKGVGKEYSEYIVTTTDTDNKIHVSIGATTCREGQKIDSSSEHQVTNSTYIQGGLARAWQMFSEVNETEIKAEITVQNEVQSTVRRIPALILVTDGNPTKATKLYTDAMRDDAVLVGSGGDTGTTMGMAFLCQLTAIYVKEQMGKKYNGITDIAQLNTVPDAIKPLFYTLGIAMANKQPALAVLDPATKGQYSEDNGDLVEMAVDEETGFTIDGYWNTYKKLPIKQDENTLGMQVDVSGDAGNQTVHRYDGITSNNEYSPNQNYVDKFFSLASTADTQDYQNVMKDIIADIELQSLYTPTMLQSTDGFHDGYVTFIDDIGEHMEIKDVKGITMGDKLFTGEHVAQLLTSDTLGELKSNDKGSESGYRLIDAIATRMGLSTAEGKAQRQQAIALIRAAYNDGLLGVDIPATGTEPARELADGVTIGNSFGWFADVNGEFLDKADADANGDSTFPVPTAYWNWLKDEPKEAPAGAVYKVRSYIFYDEIKKETEEDDGTGNGTGANDPYDTTISQMNTVYMSVQVREHIVTGEVSLVWRIPARLIPMNQYSVTLEANDAGDANSKLKSIETVRQELPVRLLYEVGPKEGYKSYQIEETMQGLKKRDGTLYDQVALEELVTDKEHVVTDKDKNYYLYTNMVDMSLQDENGDIASSDTEGHISQDINTVGYFKPSNQNERYRFSAKTMLFTLTSGDKPADDGGNTRAYNNKSADKLPQGTYWYKQYVFIEGTGIKTIWHQLDPAIIEKQDHRLGHEHFSKYENGDWYVNVNTIEYPHNAITNRKTENKTDTLDYSDYAILELAGKAYPQDGIGRNDFIISYVLGNNGRLRITPDTGIAIRKALAAGDVSDDAYNFVITATDANGKALTGKFDAVIDKPEPEKDVKGVVEFGKDGKGSIEGLKADWTAHVMLPAGTIVTVTEVLDGATDFKLENVEVKNGTSSKPNEATDIEVKPGSQAIVTFINDIPNPDPDTDPDQYGHLALKKIVSHNYKYGFDIPMDAEFTFKLTIEKKGQDGANIYAQDVLYDTDGRAYQLVNGVTSATLNPNQTIVLTGLEAGSKVTVSEIIGPHESYEVEEILATAGSVEIKDETTVQVGIKGGEKASVTVHNLYLEPDLPATGDNHQLYFWTALLGLCAVSALLLRRRKEN